MSTSTDLEYVDFESPREDWTIFELADGTILKSKYILGTVLKGKGAIGEYSVNHHVFTVAIVPKKYWGPPDSKKYTQPELMVAIEEEDIKAECKTPDMWYVYKLKDGFTLSVKLELVIASRTKMYSERGDRIYIFNIEQLVKGKKTQQPKP